MTITEQSFQEFIVQFNDLCEIHDEMNEPNQISKQMLTILKMRHDFWVEIIGKELISNYGNESVGIEKHWKGLTPDLLLTIEQDKDSIFKYKTYVIDVTFTLNLDIIEEKTKKYSEKLDTNEFFYICDFSSSFEEKMGLNIALDWKEKYVNNTGRLISKFMNKCSEMGITSTYLSEIQDLHYMGMFREDFIIKFTRKMGKTDDYLSNDKRQLLPLNEKLNIITDTIKKTLENKLISDSFNMETMSSGNYNSGFNKAKLLIKSKYVELEECKPSFLFYSPIDVSKTFFGTKWKTEQDLLKSQIKLLSTLDFPLTSLFKSIRHSLNHTETWNVFNNSVPITTQSEPDMRSKYQDYYHDIHKRRIDGEDLEIMDFITFCLNDVGIKGCDVFSKTRKTITIMEQLDNSAKEFLERSKTNMSKSEYIKAKLLKQAANQSGNYKIKALDPEKYMNDIEEYIDILCKDSPRSLPEEVFRMLYKPGNDMPMFETLKENALSDFKIFLNCLRCTPMLSNMIDITRHLSQLLHFQNLTFKHNNFSMFNSGIPDVMYLIQHGIQDRGKDVGRAYLIIKFGKISDCERRLFGFTEKYLTSSKSVIYMTKWRRLNSQRIGFHLDQAYSVVSTSFASFQRRLSETRTSTLPIEILMAETKKIFSMRFLVSISHRQLFAEMLSDIRYLYMDSFSDFADCEQFILDKYAKPIQTSFECYIFNLIPKFQEFRDIFLKSGVKFKAPTFIGKERSAQSTGGNINLPSILYGNVRIRSVQDLLDDMFLYVHTNKDPSSPYHEYVKAFKTILKFQLKYDELSFNRKKGKLTSQEDVNEFLLNDNGVGFWNLATNSAAELISSRLPSDRIKQKIRDKLRDDTLLDMNSTKSIIPERSRDTIVTEYDETFISQLKDGTNKMKKKQLELWEQVKSDEFTPYTFTLQTKKQDEKDKLVVLSGTNRCKVHDSTADLLKNTKLTKTLDLAMWNINSNKSRVVTDICIKAQYGAKREFYVINHGAKAMARVLEQVFKIVCMNLEEEMISVSGDKKMYNIQNLLDKALLANQGKQNKVFYCNGDCTKWSAAETMECLLTFVQGCSSIIDDDVLSVLEETLMAWGNKDIYVPMDLFKNVYYDMPGVSEYLKQPVFKSTQNFLQGMFNYLSSSKAVACSELTREVWKRLYPDDRSEFYHMEHSDDYAFIFVTEKAETFSIFKKIHRIVMRFLGISDSTKKTNCQQFLLEFISLLSFNGVMVYPHIKKIKEVGLNIGCLGYASDIMTTCSRVGEACRMGVPSDIAYIMGRIQNVRIAAAYGLFTSNRKLFYNNEYMTKGWTSLPVQMWGIPDVHPMLYLFSKGDANNYRLFKYHKESRPLLRTLYCLNKCEMLIDEEEYQEDRVTYATGLYHPNYTYLRNSNVLKKIRESLDFTLKDSQEYWDNHPLDLLIKPRDPQRFKAWVMSKYFQKSFGEAYMRQGRVQLVLRLSHFVKQKCMLLNLNHAKLYKYFKSEEVDKLKIDEKFTILTSFELIANLSKHLTYKENDDKLFIPTLYGFDQVSQYIYAHFERSLITLSEKTLRNTKAYPEPRRKFEYTCVNDPLRILQYLISKRDFQNDNLYLSDITTFLQDVSVMKRLAIQLQINLADITIKEINVLANVCLSSKGGGKPMLLTFNPNNDLLNSIILYAENQTVTGRFCRVTTGLYDEFSPLVPKTMLDNQLTQSNHPLESGWEMQTVELMNDVSLLLTFCSALKITRDKARKIIANLKFDFDTSVTCSDYLKNLSHLYITDQIRPTNQQIHILTSLCDFVNNDSMPLNKYLDTKLGFKYEYRKYSPKPDMTTVFVTVMNENFKIVFFETNGKSGHQMTIITETKKLQIIPLVYQIGLRLMGAVSLGEFLKRTNRDMYQYLQYYEPISGLETGRNLYANKLTGQFSLTQNPSIDIILPIILVNKLIMSQPQHTDDVHKVLRFDYENISAYSGKAKVFTLPTQNLTQFNCWSSVEQIGNFKVQMLLKDDVMRKILIKDYNFNSGMFFDQFQDNTGVNKTTLTMKTQNKFRISDKKTAEDNYKTLKYNLEIQKSRVNPIKHGYEHQIFFEDVQGMDSATATEYILGTTEKPIQDRVDILENQVLESIDEFDDFDFEFDEDNLFAGGIGETEVSMAQFSNETHKAAEKIYRFVRVKLRELEKLNNSMPLFNKFPFFTSDVNVDYDVRDERYHGIGIDKFKLCKYCETTESISLALIDIETALKECIKLPVEIHDLNQDDDFDDFDFDFEYEEEEELKESEEHEVHEKKEDVQEEEIYDPILKKNNIPTFFGIFDDPGALLQLINDEVHDMKNVVPGQTQALRLLRFFYNSDFKSQAASLFPNYIVEDFLDEEEFELDESRVFQDYNQLYSALTDPDFKYHTNSCDCKPWTTKVLNNEKACELIKFEGRGLLLVEYFFKSSSDAKAFFNELRENLKDDVLNKILRLDLIPNKFGSFDSLNEWIDYRFEFSKQPLLDSEEQEIVIEEIENKSTTSSLAGDIDIFESKANEFVQTHPSKMTTNNIVIEEQQKVYEIKKPYNLIHVISCIEQFYTDSMKYLLLGDISFKNLPTLSKLQVITITYKLLDETNKQTLKWFWMNKVLDMFQSSILPNTKIHEIKNDYWHAIRDSKSIYFKKSILPVTRFEAVLPSLSELQYSTFTYNTDDTVDIYVPLNQKDIDLAETLNHDYLLDLLGKQNLVGQFISVLKKEEELSYDIFQTE